MGDPLSDEFNKLRLVVERNSKKGKVPSIIWLFPEKTDMSAGAKPIKELVDRSSNGRSIDDREEAYREIVLKDPGKGSDLSSLTFDAGIK